MIEEIPKEKYEACFELVEQYRNCLQEHPLLKFVSYCNDSRRAFTRCTKELYEMEMVIRREKNERLKKMRLARMKGTPVEQNEAD